MIREAKVRDRTGVAVITGASSGIGAAVARQLSRAGYHVVLAARRLDRLEALAAGIRSRGGDADVVEVDLAAAQGPRALFERVMRDHRGIDLLVNNAGFGWYGFYADMPAETAGEMIGVNIAAMAQLIRLFLPHMRRSGKGHIVNIGSIAGSIPSQGVALYAATKSFIDSLTTALFRELRGSGVHVSVIRPGPVFTEFYEAARRKPTGGGIPGESFAVSAEAVAARILQVVRRPRRVAYVPRGFAVIPWIEFSFGWLFDRLGPLLLRRRAVRA